MQSLQHRAPDLFDGGRGPGRSCARRDPLVSRAEPDPPAGRPTAPAGVRASICCEADYRHAPLAGRRCAGLLSLWLGYDGLQLRRQVTSLEAELGSARAQLASSESLVARLQTTADDNAHAMTVLTAPDLARVDLEGQPVAPDARARAFWSRSRGLVFSASRLPSLRPGRTYQVWVVTASAPVSVGLLTPDEAGRAQGMFVTPADIAPPVAMAVTEEPAGGVPSPTGAKYLVGRWRKDYEPMTNAD